MSSGENKLSTTQQERNECRREAIETSRKAQVVALPIHGILSLLDDADLAQRLLDERNEGRDD